MATANLVYSILSSLPSTSVKMALLIQFIIRLRLPSERYWVFTRKNSFNFTSTFSSFFFIIDLNYCNGKLDWFSMLTMKSLNCNYLPTCIDWFSIGSNYFESKDVLCNKTFCYFSQVLITSFAVSKVMLIKIVT